jgi:hypothetical protein
MRREADAGGGWKIERQCPTGHRIASPDGHGDDPGATSIIETGEIAQGSPTVVEVESTAEESGAGFPEQKAPEQGVGRRSGDSPSMPARAPAERNRPTSIASMAIWAREVT